MKSLHTFPVLEVFDGAGVKIKRYIGTPHLRELDPFLLLDEIKSDKKEDFSAGFPDHPHRGFQTLTYVINGRIKHRDTAGNEGILADGELQWMNAGKGVIHSEVPTPDTDRLWGFQLWLNNPSILKMSEPFYYTYKATPIELSERRKVINLATGLIKDKGFYPLEYLHIELQEGEEFIYQPQARNNNFIALCEGQVVVNGKIFTGAVLIVFANKIKIEVLKPCFLLLGSAKPLGEPVVRYGPFVMNTQEEILQAIRDLKENKLT